MNEPAAEYKTYQFLPTLKKFHESPAQIRAIVGPVGSGKTSAATHEIFRYIPVFLKKKYGIRKTKWVIVRNTYSELRDTTMRTVLHPDDGWFPFGKERKSDNIYILRWPTEDIEIEVLFRSCDRPDDLKKFKSLEVTGYWIDESIEVAEPIKRMLKNRTGRFPKNIIAIEDFTFSAGANLPKRSYKKGEIMPCPVRFGIETTNPPDVEHPTYHQFRWEVPPPDDSPLPTKEPLANHVGFWQPPYENAANLRPGYYDDLMKDYADTPDWAEMYVLGKPGIILKGKLVYHNFKKNYHVAKEPLLCTADLLFRGWDNSGNCPACVIGQIPTANQVQIVKEFYSDKMGIVDFSKWVTMECNRLYPGAKYQDWADPAGFTKFSQRVGGFTSNAALMEQACGVRVDASEQNFTARVQVVDQQLARIDGLLIDSSCTRLINGFLGGYHYPEIGTTGYFSDKVDKNRFSHVHDALQYMLVRLVRSQEDYDDEDYDDREHDRRAARETASRSTGY